MRLTSTKSVRVVGAALAVVVGMGGCGDEASETSPGLSADAGAADTAGDGTSVDGNPNGDTLTVEPVESDELFANPGMGWQTFHRFATDDASLDGLPSGTAYFRWTWRDLEPVDGTKNLELIQTTLNKARAAGQTLMFRVMTAGSDLEYAPDWLVAAGCPVFTYKADAAGPTVHAPDLDEPVCMQRLTDLLQAIGNQFGQEADIQVDIGAVGLWGEWHFSGTEPQVPMPSLETRTKVVDLHLAAFPGVPQQALIGDVDTLTYAVTKGTGWRADCLGDYGFFTSTWNHMDDMYKQHVAEANAGGAWMNGPVAWESCYWMEEWVNAGFDVHEIFQYALDMHGSFVNNKSTPLPSGAEYRQEVEWLLGKLGYRFVLRTLTIPRRVTRGGEAETSMIWDNVGVAPSYGPYRLALRIAPKGGSAEAVITTEASPRDWLPGQTSVTESIVIPPALAPGVAEIAVGIVDASEQVVVRLAIEGRDADGWYPVGELEVD